MLPASHVSIHRQHTDARYWLSCSRSVYLPSAFPGFPTFSCYYRYDRSMNVQCMLIHVQYCRNCISLPKVWYSHCWLSSRHPSSLPSPYNFIIASCIPIITILIARTCSGVILRLMPAVRMQWLIASVGHSSENSTSSRLRCVRIGAAFLGMSYCVNLLQFGRYSRDFLYFCKNRSFRRKRKILLEKIVLNIFFRVQEKLYICSPKI